MEEISSGEQGGGELHVLLLEDDTLRVVQFRERLKTCGRSFVLVHRERAADAIEALKAQRWDLVLLDHDLGGRTYVDFTLENEDCGMRVAEYFSIRPEQVRRHGPIVVHSLNGPAAQQMVELIGEAAWAPFLWQREIWAKYMNIPTCDTAVGARVSDQKGAEGGPKDGTPAERDGDEGTGTPQ